MALWLGRHRVAWCGATQEGLIGLPGNKAVLLALYFTGMTIARSNTATSHSATPAPRLQEAQQQALVDIALSDRPVDDPGERLDDTDMHV